MPKQTTTLFGGLIVVAFAIAIGFACGSARPARSEDRLLKSRLKDGGEVLAAFRDVVRQANRSTVAVLVDGRQVSLGVAVGANGRILTKASELGERVRCRLRDGREFDAAVTGVHDRYDLALLKIDAADLPAVEWAVGGNPRTGQWLATPGLGDAPVAVGIVSVARRPIPPEKGVLGVQLSDGRSGPRVTHVVPNSGASRAGMQTGDIVVRAADQGVDNPQAFDRLLRKYAPGDSVNVVVLRENREVTLRATLARPLGNVLSRGYWMNRMGGRLSQRRAGFPSAIQHDTVLDPEMCGGVVVDLSGRAVGINIARAGRIETYALPADVVQPLIAELQSGRRETSEPPSQRKPVKADVPIESTPVPPAPGSETSRPKPISG